MAEPPTAVERCTNFLLHVILDHLDLPDILRAMRVSKLWQEYALNHPTYYGRLELTPADPPGASEAFLLRLSRSAGRPVSIFLAATDLRPFMPHISNHLAHIRSLVMQQKGELSFEPVLEALCQPADILSYLVLFNSKSPPEQRTPMLPVDFLADCAPALQKVQTFNVAFPDPIPHCFGKLRSLSVTFNPIHLERPFPPLVLPNPFERCPLLRELTLDSKVTLDHAGWNARRAWTRMSRLNFGGSAARVWPAFQLPIADVPSINLLFAPRESALALADTLPGTLEVIFPTPQRRPHAPPIEGKPAIFYTVVMRSVSHPGDRTRQMRHNISSRSCISAFSMPALSDRVVRLTLPLAFWENFVSLRTFGPFNALEELVLTLTADVTFRISDNEAGLPKLSCPRLQRLVLSLGPKVKEWTGAIDGVAKFARACLPRARFPLRLELQGVVLTGTYKDFPKTLSSCLIRP